MVFSVLATLGVVLLVVFLNPGSTEETFDRNVDVSAVAAQSSPDADHPVMAPDVPDDWSANYARWRSGGADQVPYWEAGYVTGAEEFVGFVQTAQPNPTWLSQRLDGAPNTGMRAVDGVRWELHEPAQGHRHLVGELGGTTVIVTGSGELADLDRLAQALQEAQAAAEDQTGQESGQQPEQQSTQQGQQQRQQKTTEEAGA